MSDLRELYQEIILDHNKQPRNFGRLTGSARRAEGHNPLCGDQITIYLQVSGDLIEDARFEGAGCAISKASASMMTEAVRGRTVCEVEGLFQGFHQMVTAEPGMLPDVDKLGKLAAFSGVCEFPARVKCASLAWHTLRAAIEQAKTPVSTE
ncbi:MAG TPA: SUF system NifU family Fe-S cluster assembly protein [Chthonomonadales bacterium]|nr:SUF system NifU family Fe-S cluster assembly protein [Chthonomonadales bacterium]